MLAYDAHPSLVPAAFVTELPAPLGELPVPAGLRALLGAGAFQPGETVPEPWPVPADLRPTDELRQAVRALLRYGGYKPSGRGKPSSEYLLRAVPEGSLPSINLAVDACNAVSHASGVPISVVDLARAREPLSVGLPDGPASYVFNASGQEIDVTGLLCLFDAGGPCANAVKDSQRTKTHAGTTRTLSVLWGPVEWRGHVERTLDLYRDLLRMAGAHTERVGPAAELA